MLGNDLLPVVIVDCDSIDRTNTGGEFRIEFCLRWYFSDVGIRFFFFTVYEDGLPSVFVLLETVPFGDTLKHTDAGVAVVFDPHAPWFENDGQMIVGRGHPTV
jgi:hypothetical protein